MGTNVLLVYLDNFLHGSPSSKSLFYAHLHCCCGTRAWATCTYITHHNTFDISISIQMSAILLKLNSKLSQKVTCNSNMLSSYGHWNTILPHMLRCQQNPPDANYSYKMEIVLGWAESCLWCPWQFSLEYKWFEASYRYLILEVILSRPAWCHRVMRHFPRFLHGQWKCFSVKCPC
jgi:hypothetical protein